MKQRSTLFKRLFGYQAVEIAVMCHVCPTCITKQFRKYYIEGNPSTSMEHYNVCTEFVHYVGSLLHKRTKLTGEEISRIINTMLNYAYKNTIVNNSTFKIIHKKPRTKKNLQCHTADDTGIKDAGIDIKIDPVSPISPISNLEQVVNKIYNGKCGGVNYEDVYECCLQFVDAYAKMKTTLDKLYKLNETKTFVQTK